ncbi:MAG: HNH endonuclease [Merismopedia sp. SIO2A8]|nr:HNH endonuclease [Merismopedia sp. SIO2A8]
MQSSIQPSRSVLSTQTASVLQHKVVVFSCTYLPVARVNIKRAIALLLTGRAESLDMGSGKGWKVRSPNLVLHIPEYIRLTTADPKRKWKVPPVNRREVLRRDAHTCQYCGSKKKLTLDHVLPRSRGGTHTWDNVVTACDPCNSFKSDRTPREAGLVLKTKPKAPIHPAIAFAEEFWKHQDQKALFET